MDRSRVGARKRQKTEEKSRKVETERKGREGKRR